MSTGRRNVPCFLCRAKRPEVQSQRVTVNRRPAWLCNHCARQLTREAAADVAAVKEAAVEVATAVARTRQRRGG